MHQWDISFSPTLQRFLRWIYLPLRSVPKKNPQISSRKLELSKLFAFFQSQLSFVMPRSSSCFQHFFSQALLTNSKQLDVPVESPRFSITSLLRNISQLKLSPALLQPSALAKLKTARSAYGKFRAFRSTFLLACNAHSLKLSSYSFNQGNKVSMCWKMRNMGWSFVEYEKEKNYAVMFNNKSNKSLREKPSFCCENCWCMYFSTKRNRKDFSLRD